MNEKYKKFLINSASSFLYQMTNTVLVLITRGIFIYYIGVEILGINNTVASLISAFSLTELGFQGVIIYNLYKPLYDKDYGKINKIMTVYRNIYRTIALIVLVVGICFVPILPILLKGIEINETVLSIYILQIINVCISYLLSYKRTLLYADNKDYYSKFVDMFFRIITNILKILAVIYTKSIIAYLLLDIAYTALSNVLVHIWCNKLFSFLKATKFDKEIFKGMFNDVKNVFFGKVSGYIYTSTDNLVISSILGPKFVTLLTNYTSLVLQLKNIVNSLLYPIVPVIGRTIAGESNIKLMFNIYTQVRYFFAGILTIPTFILIDDFICMWLGKTFVLSFLLKVLLIADFYITIVYAPCYEFNNSKGLFSLEKNIMLLGAITNIVTSIILSYILRIEGVLIGTVISQIILWIARSYICFKNVLEIDLKYYFSYWLSNFKNVLFNIIVLVIILSLKNIIFIDISISNFIFWGIASVFLFTISFFIYYKKTDLIKLCINYVKGGK